MVLSVCLCYVVLDDSVQQFSSSNDVMMSLWNTTTNATEYLVPSGMALSLSSRDAGTDTNMFGIEKELLYGQDRAVFAGMNRTYRFPMHAFERLQSENKDLMIVGVLSAAHVRSKRDTVRQTWAKGHHSVFFLIAGNWTSEIADEFNSQQDLIWMNAPETYRGVTEKVQVLFHAVHTHMQPYSSILKTDDDSYVRLDALQRRIHSTTQLDNALYWGDCQHNWVIRDPQHFRYVPESLYDNGGDKFYPVYAVGAGYLLTKDLVHCVLNRMQQHRSFPVEDAHTGVHVFACHVNCTAAGKGMVYNDFKAGATSFLIMHHVPNHQVMRRLHRRSCCSATPDPKSCAGWDKSVCQQQQQTLRGKT